MCWKADETRSNITHPTPPISPQVDLQRTFTFRNSKQTYTGIPIIAANMDTTGTFEMAQVLAKVSQQELHESEKKTQCGSIRSAFGDIFSPLCGLAEGSSAENSLNNKRDSLENTRLQPCLYHIWD